LALKMVAKSDKMLVAHWVGMLEYQMVDWKVGRRADWKVDNWVNRLDG